MAGAKRGSAVRTVLKVSLTAVAVAVSLILIAVAAIYFWPHESEELQTGTRETVSYDAALERVAAQQQRDQDNSVTSECQSTLMTHGDQSEGAVVFLHGIRVCPSQFDELATYFFEQGYNVYIPVAPAHGTAVNQDHANVKADELVDYLNESVTIATGLGEEVGVVGLSGGAALGTWAAHYRPEVERLLLLSAFYEPSVGHAPSWQLPFLKTLYGYHLVPDQFSTTTDPAAPGFSYRALAQYLIIGQNFREDPSGLALKSVGTVISEDDVHINKELAESIPRTLAEANGLELLVHHIPQEWEADHEIINDTSPAIRNHRDELFQLYLDFYEGRPGALN
ncbi:Alpha/beta hydrolase family protein [Corynebacterium faecale]|nr:Alpha/beta hydrolase family protein [Corynebacterium faecale]